MGGLRSDRENAPKNHYRPSSMTGTNISDGNKCSHPAGMNTVFMHLLDSRRPHIRGPATSNSLVPTSCTSRVVGDSERDPLHLELIHSMIGEIVTAQHAITHRVIIYSPAPISTDPPTLLSILRVRYREVLLHSQELSPPSKDLNTFLAIYL